MAEADTNRATTPAQDKRLRPDDVKSHTVVVVWNGSVGEERYLYKDAMGWYVLGWPCPRQSERHYLTTDPDGFFEGVTLP